MAINLDNLTDEQLNKYIASQVLGIKEYKEIVAGLVLKQAQAETVLRQRRRQACLEIHPDDR